MSKSEAKKPTVLEPPAQSVLVSPEFRRWPPVSAVYMKILLGAQAPSCLIFTISSCGELAAFWLHPRLPRGAGEPPNICPVGQTAATGATARMIN